MLVSPIRAMATAPSAEVVVIPISCRTEPATMGPHISVTMAGKWAVMKASWYPQEKKPRKISV